jgi:hypothetical protein
VVTQASLGAEVKPGRNVLMVKQDDMETEFALCSLTEGKLECTPLDLYFRDETVTFAVQGQCEIHLSGHVIDDAGGESDDDESEDESEEEQQGATSNGPLLPQEPAQHAEVSVAYRQITHDHQWSNVVC